MFLLALGLTILAAAMLPAVPLLAEVLTPTATAGIFLLNGWAIPQRELRGVGGRLPTLAAIHALGFLGGALTAWLIASALSPWLSPAGCQALILTGLLPTTITSCVVATRRAGGDTGLAVVVAVTSNLIGILILPPVAIALFGAHDSLDPLRAVGKLLAITAAPLAVGMWWATRRPPGPETARWINPASQTGLLLALIGVFNRSFHGPALPWGELPLLVLASVAGHLVLFAGGWRLGLALGGPATARAAAFCAGQKTATVGVPILAVVYADDPARLGSACLVLVTWFTAQLVIAGILAPRLAAKPD